MDHYASDFWSNGQLLQERVKTKAPTAIVHIEQQQKKKKSYSQQLVLVAPDTSKTLFW